ncbi:uncharacterized protein LOC102352014 isoform X2 [Latimeria chalumnae]|uniref:uncharacterized protein LOC102352014 isoform X2 n=1 Tax=Latimeria chalumnae TaxID=7897 RepID=UPI00313D60DD
MEVLIAVLLLTGISSAVTQAPSFPPGLERIIVIARYDHVATEEGILSFQKGDLIAVLQMFGIFLSGRSLVTREEGLFDIDNMIFVNLLEAEHWFFEGSNHNDAERQFLAPGKRLRSFLVRYSETSKGSYSNLGRDYDPLTGDRVNHYKIQTHDNGGFYNSPQICFCSLQERVSHYQSLGQTILIAVDDYDAKEEGDISFQKGNRIVFLHNSMYRELWRGRSLVTGEEGYFPSYYVSQVKLLDAEPWFFKGVSHKDAERQLLAPENKVGSFMIWDSESNKDRYTLSVRDYDSLAGDRVNHYKIQTLDNGGFYISPQMIFCTLQELVSHYQKQNHGLCQKLTDPCIKKPQKAQEKDAREISRETLKMEQRQGAGQTGNYSHLMGNYDPLTGDLYNGGFYSSPQIYFCTIQELISHYQSLGQIIVIALKDYNATEGGFLKFQMGDPIAFLNEFGKWGRGRSLMTGEEGFFPNNYAVPVNQLESDPWFFKGVSRKDAERQLLAPENKVGSFMIRDSESNKGSYSLSVRDYDPVTGDGVKHYKIRTLDNGGFYISPQIIFCSLQELVRHYQEQNDGLCQKLTDPCVIKKPQKSWERYAREILQDIPKMEEQQGAGQLREDNMVRENDSLTEEGMNHYKIQAFSNRGFYISPWITYCILQRLSFHYPSLGQKIVVAMYDFYATEEDELSFHEGDLIVVQEKFGNWWLGSALATGEEGFIPRNYVAQVKSLETEPWFFEGASRKDAESQLLAPGKRLGTFLIRQGETNKGRYSLSVKDYDPLTGYGVKHYKIQVFSNGGFYIFSQISFCTLQELVSHYQSARMKGYVPAQEGVENPPLMSGEH